MADPQEARLTQLRNIQSKTGTSIAELHALLAAAGLAKAGERRAWLMDRFKLGYGDANTVALLFGKAVPPLEGAAPAPPGDTVGAALDVLYSGAKAHLRTLHSAVISLTREFGPFEEAPKQTYISLRRRKQFAMVGPATKDSIELGFNYPALPASGRLTALPPGRMCQYKLRISKPEDIDDELSGWLRMAYEGAA